MLKLEGVRAAYGTIPVLFDIHLELHAGESVSVLGPNGAGKTSLLRAIMGANDVVGGTIEFEGQNLAGLPEHRRADLGIGYVPEGRHVWPTLTVEENLLLGAWSRRRKKAELRSQLDAVLDLFPRLQERYHSRGGVLSGGEQQMVAVGRALMSKPRLLLVDEPSIGLSPLAYENVFQALSRLQATGELAVLLVEQKAQEALSLCSKAYVLVSGTIQASGSADEIREGASLQEAYFG